ncbi:glycogen synthase GlgA [Pseudaestuariivita atlantica]|uniref:Glycogen synthase n=1 Tax=Pseudaestuariivita atlantica TaxID=1317121 RepID=A0A0L1JK79_9RHOB|nr:glycogen synthase GlgA [Pseudaestuariivita atlantica]KNG92164.1 glycogen synthase [Pseudaestuariivita atlantica]
MKVLSVTSECVPLVKTGGLADVAGALPGALAPMGVEMATLLPGYPAVMAAVKGRVVAEWSLFGGPARVIGGQLDEAPLYVLDAPHLYDRPGSIYLDGTGKDWPDNPERFAALCKAAARIAGDGIGGWVPDVLHLHDWQAGLTPVYLRETPGTARTVMTVHNIAFQGLAPASKIEALGLPRDLFTQAGFEFWGQVSALKAGLALADRITTVSPSYAQELMTPEFGMGMEGLIRHREADVTGILNGIDLDLWGAPYKTPKGKARHKAALRAEFGLPDWPGPLCIVVSRLTEQKGLDLLLDALPALLDNGGQLALLGSGNADLEARYRDLAVAHEGVAVQIGYDEGLSHRMMAGADAILVPSRFEPCGLTQLYGLAHGTVPVVAMTGGLADTVIPLNPATRAKGVATGFQFRPVTAHALAVTLRQVVEAYGDKELWTLLQKNAMAQPVGWDASAAEYAALYESLVAT